MADSEEYFPRGGKKPTTTYFKQNENYLGVTEKGERKKRKPKKKSEDDDGYLSDELGQEVDQASRICGIWLQYKVIKEGLLLLGRVQQVQETKVHISLPCRMQGVVMACHISEAYNKLLEAYVNDQIDKVCELSQMFRPGQYVGVKVLEVEKHRLMVSMMPQHVNSGRMSTELHKGTVLQAAVSSVEDHGYVMDLGIPNTRAFLPKNSANPEIALDTGFLTWVTVTSPPTAESSVVTLSSELTALQTAVQRVKTHVLTPGTALEFTVDKPLDNGIEGRLMDNTTAYIQRNQVDTVKGKKPGLGHKIRARLLYVVPPKNTPFLTMKKIFDTTFPDLTEERKYRDGDIIEEAQVIKIVGRSIHFKLGEGSIGMLSLRRVAVHEDLSDEQVLLNSYPIGSIHKVRVLCYHLSDYVYSLSDDPALLAEKYFTLAQLSVGDVLPATVTEVTEGQLKVTVGRVHGSIPQIHMTESGIFVDPKKASNSKLPKKKFKVGQELKCRVWLIEPTKYRMVLTLKPSLLDPELPVLQTYDLAAVGKVYTGVIVSIKDYLLVSFFNNVAALIPKRFVSAEPLENLSDAFHLGQIIKCTITSVYPEEKKMYASLTTPPFTPSANPRKPTKRKIDDQEVLDEKQKTDDIENKNTKKKLKRDPSDEANELDESHEPTKKKKRKDKGSKLEELNENPIDIDTNKDESKRKKKKKDKNTDENITEEITEINKTEVKDRKKKDGKVVKEPSETGKGISEESDAIETDINDDSEQVLSPEELNLTDLSTCQSIKQHKKRVSSLQKCVKERKLQIESIEKEIAHIEDKGLNAKNKKSHTAMHMKKLVIEDGIEKLMETINLAKDKILELKSYNENKKNEDDKGNTSTMKNDNIDKISQKNHKQEKIHDENVETSKEVKVLDSLKPVLQVPSVKDFWALDTNTVADKAKVEESSSSDEEEEEKPKKKRKKKLTVAEKADKARQEEERIREMEKRAIESESAPRSSDQFERALLAQPDCSELWIAYMAFHLQATEIEKARAVGRKALRTINFREEAEKLNVWLALLNLEHRFGTKETQQKTLEDALQMNDKYKIHSKLLDILVDTSKQQELVSTVELMMRKYRRQSEVYAACGDACFKAGLVEKARQVMQKGIAALEKKEHVSLLVRFAQLERARGERERAEALFEQVLAVYPQRVDVAAAYADMLLKAADVERLRQVMERMTSLQLPARKMKVLFKKWIEVEEKIGDQAHVESIRQRALEFIHTAKF